jgi:uncharacterized protein (DUF305 family)
MAMGSMGGGGQDSKTPNAGFLEAMIKHHQDALDMSRAYLKLPAGDRLASVTDLAKGIIEGQSDEIDKMRGMLAEAKSSGHP